ncbi:MAG: hypothetical protein Q7P63_03850 [Verrucomicrobiota bacterium JB022]|nr:hypothetical protein [Verrucomicrobiota bacterium JB022]
MNTLFLFLQSLSDARTNILLPALISLTISALISWTISRSNVRHKAEIDYEYEQKRALRNLQGEFYGRIVLAATDLNHRLFNLYENQTKKWLCVDGNYKAKDNYYFRTLVYRFLNFYSHIRMTEKKAILLDVRIASPSDHIFLNYMAAFKWVMTDVKLFEDLDYDSNNETDHFFSDNLRRYCDYCSSNSQFISMDKLDDLIENPEERILPICHFFDDLRRNEDRLRWDRLVAMHLLLVAFLNDFGTKRHRTTQEQFRKISNQMEHKEILRNLKAWIKKLDLHKSKGAREILKTKPN